MLLNLTPSGNEFQRKMLLEHTSTLRNLFIGLLFLVPIAIIIGDYYSDSGDEDELSTDYMQSVAMIIVNETTTVSQGTAFLVANDNGIEDGYLLTARHVIEDTSEKTVYLLFPNIETDDGEPFVTTASIVWTTEIPFDGTDINTLRYDAALLKLDDPSLIPEDVAGFQIEKEISVKQPVALYGFPDATGYATNGQIANTSFKEVSDLFTLNFDLAQGISGAPIYDEETGAVFGIAIATGTEGLQNICISTRRVIELMDQDGFKKLLEP
jgi:S1-C subfamily serine protease